MQIFEITARKKLDEVNFGAFAKGVGNQLVKNVKSDLGIQSDPAKVSGVAAQGAASAATIAVAKQQAIQQQQVWNKTLANLSKDVSERGLSQIPPKDLAQNFMKQFQGMLQPHGLRASMGNINGVPIPEIDDFSGQLDPDALGGQAKKEAEAIIDDIDDAVSGILQAQPETSPATLAQLWQNLAVKISAAANLMQFSPGAAKAPAAGAPVAANAAMIPPVVKPLVAALGTDPASMKKFGDLLRTSGKPVKATGNPTLDAFLEQSGIRFAP